ncbi:MAG TPA: competence/damage-inducible protein A [Kofleriaceae bacterium]|nr:competence/damage-inducible protein A [Kofleriaceae bacterium]
MFAEILTIGDELTRGEIVDTNKAWLAGQLWDQDVTVRWMTSCRDDVADLRRAITTAAGRADLVLTSGGLGPTEDDLTCDVVSEAAGVEVTIDEPARARLEQLLASRGRPVDSINLRQARVPAGARVLANPAGLAPGFEIPVGGVPVVCLPGVPRELQAIYAAGLRARVAELRDARGAAPRIARRIYRAFGRGESQYSQALRGAIDGVPGATLHYQVKFPETLVKVVVKDPDGAAAAARLEAIDAEVRARIGRHVYATGDDNLPIVVGRLLLARGATIATAESCTGGLLGALLTELPGSSGYFLGGAITYANAEKVRQLGVAQATLDRDGAVSEATVREMAHGIRARTGASIGVGISGIAGPGGGSAEKPVGTVWLAVEQGDAPATTFKMMWPGSRDQVRTLAAWWGLELVRQALGADGAAS